MVTSTQTCVWPRSYFPDASVDPTEARKDAGHAHGRWATMKTCCPGARPAALNRFRPRAPCPSPQTRPTSLVPPARRGYEACACRARLTSYRRTYRAANDRACDRPPEKGRVGGPGSGGDRGIRAGVGVPGRDGEGGGCRGIARGRDDADGPGPGGDVVEQEPAVRAGVRRGLAGLADLGRARAAD